MTTKPNVVVTDTDTACGNNPDYPPTVSNPSTSVTGALAFPGLPYGTYTVCVDNGTSGGAVHDTVTGVANTSYTTGNPVEADLYSGGAGTYGTRTMSDEPELLTSRLRDERGFTLVEVMVALAIGLVVSTATLAIVIVSVHLGSNYTDRVDANQQGRLAMERITQALNSSCVTPTRRRCSRAAPRHRVDVLQRDERRARDRAQRVDDLAHRRRRSIRRR